MIPLLDVNVLIPVHRGEHAAHRAMFEYVDRLRGGQIFFGVPEIALSAVIRIVTHSKIFRPPSSITEAFDFAASITSSPKCLLVRPSQTHWRVFENLSRRVGAGGKLVPDAYLAALAIDQGFEFVTNDADFAKFPGLTWRHPLAAQSIFNPN